MKEVKKEVEIKRLMDLEARLECFMSSFNSLKKIINYNEKELESILDIIRRISCDYYAGKEVKNE